MSLPVPGARVGAWMGGGWDESPEPGDEVLFLGWGVYVDLVEPEGAEGQLAKDLRAMGQTAPRLVLDNGDVVWGFECWWDEEEEVRRCIQEWEWIGARIVTMSIADFRKRCRQ